MSHIPADIRANPSPAHERLDGLFLARTCFCDAHQQRIVQLMI